jgi:aminopeptidase N
MKRIALVLLLALTFTTVFSQDKTVTYLVDGAANPPDLIVTLKHIEAHIAFRPAENRVIGTAEFTFIPNRYQTDSIVFYCPDFVVKSVSSFQSAVSSQQSAVAYHYNKPNLVLEVHSLGLEKGKEYSVKITYEATPMAGAIYFVGWRPEETGKRKAIWAHRPHGWLPYMDARITMDMFFTFDKNFTVFANGERLETTDNKDNTRTWHYRMAKDHPYFSTSLVIGDYDFKTAQSAGGVPLEYWYYRDMPARVGSTYLLTDKMMDFFEKEIGSKYPYPVYRQAPVIDYMYGAMECTTATVFGDFMLIDPHAFWQRNYINTNAHEMAHQWFGDCVAHLVNKDVWLTESFATYYAKIFEKSVFGEEQYRNIMNDELNLAMSAAAKNSYPVNSSRGGVERIYQKGSLVLGMLRYVMGDKEFRDAVKLYFDRYAFGYAQTNDFLRCTYDVTGKSYDWFFDEWIRHGGEPAFKVSCAVKDDSLGKRFTMFDVVQVHDTSNLIRFFRMPVVFEVHYKDGSKDSVKTWVENKTTNVTIPNPSKKTVDFVLFDPGREILKKVTFDRSFPELSAQAMKAKNLLDRYDAVVAMRSIPVEQKRNLLLNVFYKEKFHLVKTEIIDQLSKDDSCGSRVLFARSLSDPDANVRKAVLSKVSPIPSSLEYLFELSLDDFSYLNQELALDNLCRSFPDAQEVFLDKMRNSYGWRGMNIRMKWLEISIRSGKKEFLPELIDYTGPKYEFETRMNSLSVLMRLEYIDDTVRANARSAAKHWNNKLSGVGKEYLKHFNEAL